LQDDFLYEGTIRENILFPRPNATEAQLLAAVAGAYVNEFTDRFDLGLESGKHDELIAKQGRYWELFTYQSRI
jgi:ABC-type multidrug transport system fused ATPase/permease subunit